MRLGQLARKLALRPDEIVEFLFSKNITIAEGSNTRLEDAHLALIIQRFAPNMLTELTKAEDVPDLPVPIVEVQTVPSPKIISEEISATEEVAFVHDSKVEPAASTPEEEKEEEVSVELIKAPKVELSGLKVLGKIDLPDLKKKEEPQPENIDASLSTPVADTVEQAKKEIKTTPSNRREDRDYKPRKNPVAVQREREAEDAEEKKIAAVKREKESRSQYYQQRVKPTAPIRAARIFNEDVIELSAEPTKLPTTLLGKFWKWFRS